MPGYIYLIMMADGVYKVGRTQQDYGNTLKRLKSYPPDSVIVYVRKIQGYINHVESLILELFRNEFGKHVRGNEYFIGDENRMIEIINQVVHVTPASPSTHPLKRFIESDEIIIDKSRLCPLKVLISVYNDWCRRNEIGRSKFNENFYKGVFSQYDISVYFSAHKWRDEMYIPQPFVMGMDIKTDVERHVGRLNLDGPTRLDQIILGIELCLPEGIYVSKAEVIKELEKKGCVVAPISGIVHPPPEPLK